MSWPVGECTAWVAEFFNIPFSGNAYQWAANAKQYGWTTSSTPQVGDIAVWQPGIGGSDSQYGHVAVVTGVSPAGFTVSEMNWTNGLGGIDNRNVTDVAGISFISPPVSAETSNFATMFSAAGGNPSTAATLLSSGGSNPDPWASIPVIGGLTDPFWAAGEAATSIPGAIGNAVGAVLTFAIKAGEVLIGLGLIWLGVKLIAEHSGEAGQTVVNVMNTIGGTVKDGAKLAGVAAAA